MKYCSACGSPMNERAVLCVKCGVPCEGMDKKEEIGTSTIVCSYILAILMPILGTVAGIYLMCKKQVGHGVITLVLSLVMWAFWYAFMMGV